MGHKDAIYSLAFAWNTVISGSGDGTVGFRNLANGSYSTLNVPSATADIGVTSLAISPNVKIMATGSGDSIIRIWDVVNGRLLQQLGGHTESVYSVAFTPDCKRLVSGSFDKTVRCWDVDAALRPPMASAGIATNSVLLHDCEVRICRSLFGVLLTQDRRAMCFP